MSAESILPRPSLSSSRARPPRHLRQAVHADRGPDAAAAQRLGQVMAEPILYHRAPAFVEIYARVLERLPLVFQTGNDVLCFAASGTGRDGVRRRQPASRPGEPAVVASCGKFGERWAELCDAYGADTLHLEFEWGEKVDPARARRGARRAARGRRGPCSSTQSETSTGVAQRRPGAERGRHAAAAPCSASTPSRASAPSTCRRTSGAWTWSSPARRSRSCARPGLGFASVSERALALRGRAARGGRYYFDWERTAAGPARGAAEQPLHARRDAVSRARRGARADLCEEGLERVFERHALLARAARAGVEALGLERFGPDDENANVVTASRACPRSIDGAKVPEADARPLRRHDRRRTGPPEGQDRPHRPLRLLRRLRHRDRAHRRSRWRFATSATTSSPAPASARPSGCSPRPARPSRSASVRQLVADANAEGPGQGEDRRRRRRAAARATSTSSSASRCPTTSCASGSASSTGS